MLAKAGFWKVYPLTPKGFFPLTVTSRLPASPSWSYSFDVDIKLSRKEVARIFGLSESEIRRREANQVIRPKRTERGICYYLDADLPIIARALNRKVPSRYAHLLDVAIDWRHPRHGERKRPLPFEIADATEEDHVSERGMVFSPRLHAERKENKPRINVDEWKRVLSAFREGKSAADCCELFGILPATMRLYLAEYEDLKALGSNGLHLSQAILDALHKLPLEGPVPIQKGEDLVEIITKLLEDADQRAQCASCSKGVAEVCRRCLRLAVHQAQQPPPAPAPPTEPTPQTGS